MKKITEPEGAESVQAKPGHQNMPSLSRTMAIRSRSKPNRTQQLHRRAIESKLVVGGSLVFDPTGDLLRDEPSSHVLLGDIFTYV